MFLNRPFKFSQPSFDKQQLPFQLEAMLSVTIYLVLFPCKGRPQKVPILVKLNVQSSRGITSG